MALKFYNIRSKETRVAESEPMISAMFNSGNLTENSMRGQDFGWRLAPEVVVQMKRIQNDAMTLQRIAIAYQKPVEDIKPTDVLMWISDHTEAEDAPVAQDGDFEEQYLSDIRQMERESEERARAARAKFQAQQAANGETEEEEDSKIDAPTQPEPAKETPKKKPAEGK